MSIFRIRGKLHEADTASVKLKIPRAKEFDKESSVTKNILKGEYKNITYEHEQKSLVLKSLPSLSSELKRLAKWGYKCDYRGTGLHPPHEYDMWCLMLEFLKHVLTVTVMFWNIRYFTLYFICAAGSVRPRSDLLT